MSGRGHRPTCAWGHIQVSPWGTESRVNVLIFIFGDCYPPMPVLRTSLPLVVALFLPTAHAFADTATNTTASNTCSIGNNTVAAWPELDLKRWDVREFAGASQYRLTEHDGLRVLDARTEGKASVLYRQQEVDLAATPILSWSWLVDSIYDNPNEQSKKGDDFPARLYVVVQTGFLPWDTHAINYVFASSTPQDTQWLNPFTDKAMMIAVQSGQEAVGSWHCEQRDVAADFAMAFPEVFPEPPKNLSGYAVMIDGDNGGFSGQARFGGLMFEPG